MRKLMTALMLAALTLAVAPVGAARGATTPRLGMIIQQHLIGEVTAVDEASGQLTVKTDAGASVSVATDERTAYRRVPPGQTSLENAERITRADVRVGDRVLVPNGAGGGQAAARQVIVMAREAVASQRAKEREEWRRRGLNGRITALDAGKKEITVEARSRGAAETMTVAAAGNVRFRRYAPDSLRPADAVSGSFADLRVGDQVRILGDRDAAGSRFTAEEILSGSIARLTGLISEVDPNRNLITVQDDRTKQLVTIALGKNTTLRRLSPEFAETLRQRRERRREAGGERAEGQAGERRGRRDGQRGQRAEGGEGAERQRRGGGGMNPQQMFESQPAITIAELKKGDAVIVTLTTGADATRGTAVSLVTGEAALIQSLQRFQRGTNQGNMSPGLPSGVAGGNTGDREP